jgi:hypothetical protein
VYHVRKHQPGHGIVLSLPCDQPSEKMTDLQMLIASVIGIVVFYFLLKYLYRTAEKFKPEIGEKFKKNFKAIKILYAIAMVIQLAYFVNKVFFK